MSANVLVLFVLVETTDMDFGTLADISGHGTLADISGHWWTWEVLEINGHFRTLNFGTLVDNMSGHKAKMIVR